MNGEPKAPKARERGSVLVEFAMAVWVAMLLIFGIIDFGRALFTYHLVSNAARLGSRYAIVRGSTCTATGCPTTSAAVQTYVQGVSPGIVPSALTVTTTWPDAAGCSNVSTATNGPGCRVQVQASYTFTFVMPFLSQVAMTSTSQMVISQ